MSLLIVEDSIEFPTLIRVEDLQTGTRLEFPGSCPEVVRALVEQCWILEPSRRPLFSQLVDDLTRLSKV